MKNGLILRALSALAVIGSTMAPAVAAPAPGKLESSFDKAFSVETRTQKPGVVKAPVSILPVQAWQQPSGPTTYASSLEATVAALANAGQGRIGVAATDLGTGRTVSVLGSQPFPMASTSKLAIVATFLQGVDQGRFSLSDRYPLMVPVPSAKYSSTVAPVRAGATMTAWQLIDRTIINSDNQATDALLRVVGGPAAVNKWVRESAGLTGFSLNRDIATLVRDDGQYDPARVVDQRDAATPLTMVQLLTGLHQGRWLSQSSTGVILSAMERCVTGKRRLKALLPGEARVLHKTGTLSNTSSDVGIIKTPDGRDIAVAIYVTGQGGKSFRDSRIASIARAIYDGYLSEASNFRRTAAR
ncbi:beta-lactamase class A [Novosphingobium kunmingense]|uniref:Beta-lactamase n=1 Tax=Novosphingobium kunmingense TaxID=1211806 RepID=A0A2N0HJX2_9SPHN|nr:serine hydrolase [Novosphingobium kunmingense]PKB19253.1 beta-lactamase class A [Novosphingobium kunmingense]